MDCFHVFFEFESCLAPPLKLRAARGRRNDKNKFLYKGIIIFKGKNNLLRFINRTRNNHFF